MTLIIYLQRIKVQITGERIVNPLTINFAKIFFLSKSIISQIFPKVKCSVFLKLLFIQFPYSLLVCSGFVFFLIQSCRFLYMFLGIYPVDQFVGVQWLIQCLSSLPSLFLCSIRPSDNNACIQ